MSRLVIAGLVGTVAAIGIYKSFAAPTVDVDLMEDTPEQIARDTSDDAALAKLGGCTHVTSVECTVARGRVTMRVADAFDTLSTAGDDSAGDSAIAALDLQDPHAVRAALDYIGRFDVMKKPGARDRVERLLAESRILAVGELAARLLHGSSYSPVASEWEDSHKALSMDRYSVQYWSPMLTPDLEALGFTLLPGATPFAPMDASHAVGMISAQSTDQVLAFFAKQPNAQVVKQADFAMFAQRTISGVGGASGGGGTMPSQTDIAEIQRLSAEYEKTKDPATLQKLMAMSQKMQGSMPKPTAPTARVDNTGTPLDLHLSNPVDAVILETDPKNGIERMVYVFPEPTLKQTVIQYSWDLKIQPSMFPTDVIKIKAP